MSTALTAEVARELKEYQVRHNLNDAELGRLLGVTGQHVGRMKRLEMKEVRQAVGDRIQQLRQHPGSAPAVSDESQALHLVFKRTNKWVQVIYKGHAMIPLIQYGQILCCNPHGVPVDGDVVVAKVRKTGQTVVRYCFDRGLNWLLVPHSARAPRIELPKEEIDIWYTVMDPTALVEVND